MKKEYFLVGAFALVLFIVNLFLVYPYLFQSIPGWIESIEVSYITISRWWAHNFPHIFWNPYWYAGFPMRFSYVPLLPFSTAILGSLIGSFTRAYHFLTGFAYALVPVSLFFLIRFLTKDSLAAFLGALFFSLLPPLDRIFIHSQEAQALFPGQSLPPWRLMTMVIWGEGPHNLAQVFLPLAGLFYFKALRSQGCRYLILASFFIALVALSNLIGLWALGIFLGAVFMVYLIWDHRPLQVVKKTLCVVILGYLFSAFWLTPGFIKGNLFSEGGQLLASFFNCFPWGLLAAVLIISLFFYFLRRQVKSVLLAFTITWFSINLLVVTIFYKYNFSLAPQARRYIPELDMAMAALLAFLISWLNNWLLKRFLGEKIRSLAKIVLPAALIIVLLLTTNRAQKAARDFSRLNNHHKTGYKEKYMNQYLLAEVKKGERIFISSNYTFWLNFETDIWQLRGGYWQASTHPWQPHAEYQIIHGQDKETSLYWLKIFAISWLVVNTPESDIHYRDFEHASEFVALLGKGEVVVYPTERVYRIPLKQGMAAPVFLSETSNLPIPQDGADKAALKEYLDWLEGNPRSLSWKMITNDRYQIQGSLAEGEGIRVAMTYDLGFKAKDDRGQSLKVRKDPLGFLLIEPKTAGEQTIILNYGPSFDFWLGWGLLFSGILLVIFLKRRWISESD